MDRKKTVSGQCEEELKGKVHKVGLQINRPVSWEGICPPVEQEGRKNLVVNRVKRYPLPPPPPKKKKKAGYSCVHIQSAKAQICSLAFPPMIQHTSDKTPALQGFVETEKEESKNFKC